MYFKLHLHDSEQGRRLVSFPSSCLLHHGAQCFHTHRKVEVGRDLRWSSSPSPGSPSRVTCSRFPRTLSGQVFHVSRLVHRMLGFSGIPLVVTPALSCWVAWRAPACRPTVDRPLFFTLLLWSEATDVGLHLGSVWLQEKVQGRKSRKHGLMWDKLDWREVR